MSKREILGGFWLAVFTGGIASVTAAFTVASASRDNFYMLVVSGALMILVGISGLIYLFLTAPAKAERKRTTAFIKGGKIGRLSAKDVESSADKFIEDTKVAEATFDRIRHKPRS